VTAARKQEERASTSGPQESVDQCEQAEFGTNKKRDLSAGSRHKRRRCTKRRKIENGHLPQKRRKTRSRRVGKKKNSEPDWTYVEREDRKRDPGGQIMWEA